MPFPQLKPQEIPYDDPLSNCFFKPNAEKPFLSTPAAIDHYRLETILACLAVLQQKAIEHDGIDYLQVFEGETQSENLWFMEDGDGGAITALLPSDY